MQRRDFLKSTGIGGTAALVGLTGCTGGGGGGGDGDDGTTTSPTGTGNGGGTTEDIDIGMVYALGGLGDKSFNDMAHRGIKRAEDKFPSVSHKDAEPSNPSDFSTLQRKFATSSSPDYDLVCCIGFAQTSALKKNAKNYGDQRFMIVDSVVDRDNVASYLFREHLGSFQVGHLAGLMTTMDFSAGKGSTNDETTVGFVGGKEIPLIKKFQAGYMAGVKHANENVDIKSAYAGSWSDPAKGKEIALSMYNSGADIVYHAAGGTGIGVFKAAKEKGRYAIGVDADQSMSTDFEEWILASMVKHVNTAVFTSVKHVVNDNYKGGSITKLGLEKNGVEAVLGTQLGPEIPESVKSALETSREEIIDGKIDVPTKPKNV